MRTRLTATVGLAVGLLLLTSCRSDPKVAAYVGDTTITEARVTEVVNDFNQKAAKAAEGPAQSAPQTAPQATRNDAVQLMVLQALCKRLSEQKGFTFQPAPAQDDDALLIKIFNDVDACVKAIPASSEPADEQDMRDLFAYQQNIGNIPPDAQYEKFLPQLQSNVRLHNALLGADKLTLNPRYSAVNFVGLPIIPGGVVTDAPRTTPQTPPQQQSTEQ